MTMSVMETMLFLLKLPKLYLNMYIFYSLTWAAMLQNYYYAKHVLVVEKI